MALCLKALPARANLAVTSSRTPAKRNVRTSVASGAAAGSQPESREPFIPQNVLKTICSSVAAWSTKQSELVKAWVQTEEAQTQGKKWFAQARCMVLIAPFAAAQALQPTDMFLLLSKSVCQFVKLYLLLLFIRVVLTWFPTFNWDKQPWMAIRQVTDPYLNLFQGLVPPLLGSMDMTPLIGFMILQLLAGYLETQDPNERYW